MEIIGDHSTEVSSVYQRGLWLWVGEEGPSCRGHECGLAASLLVRLLHILTPRIFGHSVHPQKRKQTMLMGIFKFKLTVHQSTSSVLI